MWAPWCEDRGGAHTPVLRSVLQEEMCFRHVSGLAAGVTRWCHQTRTHWFHLPAPGKSAQVSTFLQVTSVWCVPTLAGDCAARTVQFDEQVPPTLIDGEMTRTAIHCTCHPSLFAKWGNIVSRSRNGARVASSDDEPLEGRSVARTDLDATMTNVSSSTVPASSRALARVRMGATRSDRSLDTRTSAIREALYRNCKQYPPMWAEETLRGVQQ